MLCGVSQVCLIAPAVRVLNRWGRVPVERGGCRAWRQREEDFLERERNKEGQGGGGKGASTTPG